MSWKCLSWWWDFLKYILSCNISFLGGSQPIRMSASIMQKHGLPHSTNTKIAGFTFLHRFNNAILNEKKKKHTHRIGIGDDGFIIEQMYFVLMLRRWGAQKLRDKLKHCHKIFLRITFPLVFSSILCIVSVSDCVYVQMCVGVCLHSCKIHHGYFEPTRW